MMAHTTQVSMADTDRACWDAYVDGHPHATFFHRYDWLTLVRQTYGGVPYYLTACRSGAVVGVLPLLKRRCLGGGPVLVSVPFADEGGLLADDPEAQAALLRAARELGEREKADYVELRQTASLGASLPVDSSRITLKLALPADADELWSSLKAKVRNQVRKAERCGLHSAHSDDLRADLATVFYPVYSRNTRDLGSPMHAPGFFQSLADLFPGKVFMAQVALGDVPVGAAVAVVHQGVFSVPWAGALRSHFSMCPNNLLYWKLLTMALEQGCATFDFGRSARDSGTHHFKQQWGARELPLYYEFLSLGQCPRLGEKRHGAGYRVFSKVWQKTPLSIARALGPKLFARLPI